MNRKAVGYSSLGATILCLGELLLTEGCDKQPDALELFGIKDPVEELIVVHNGDHFPLRYISKIKRGCQIDG